MAEQGLASRDFQQEPKRLPTSPPPQPPAGPHRTVDTFWQTMRRTPKGWRDMHTEDGRAQPNREDLADMEGAHGRWQPQRLRAPGQRIRKIICPEVTQGIPGQGRCWLHASLPPFPKHFVSTSGVGDRAPLSSVFLVQVARLDVSGKFRHAPGKTFLSKYDFNNHTYK